MLNCFFERSVCGKQKVGLSAVLLCGECFLISRSPGCSLVAVPLAGRRWFAGSEQADVEG